MLRDLTGDVHNDRSTVSTQATHAQRDWQGPRQVQFAAAVEMLLPAQLTVWHHRGAAASALTTYARQIDEATTTIANAQASYDRAMERVTPPAASADTLLLQPFVLPVAEPWEATMARWSAQGALTTLDEQRQAAASALDRLTSALVPGGARMDPAALARRVTAGFPSDYTVFDPASVTLPPADASPEEVALWWAALPPRAQLEVPRFFPELIGGLDGVPGAARDVANRISLTTYRDGLEARIEELRATLSGAGRRNPTAYRELQQLLGKVEELEIVASTLARGNRQLLVFDSTSGKRLHAAVAVGNIDTADHVAVFTPGLASNVRDSLKGYDNDMAALRSRALELGATSVATVTWIGYDAPQWGETIGPNSVALSGSAERGAKDLTPFLKGIDTSRSDGVHLTAIGHSYGSYTTGLALREETGVDDAIFYGSPGIVVDKADEIKVPRGHVNVLEADWDGVADLSRFGKDPGDMDDVRHLSTDESRVDGRDLDRVTGHSDYLKERSTSQHNMAVIVGGRPEDRLVLAQ
jgi:hypothetical protein